MQERLGLIVEEKRRGGGITVAVAASFVLHGLLVFWFIRTYQDLPRVAASAPIARYVELMKSNPQEFTEAPGAKLDRAPIRAPLSDANRKAAMPKPTGDQPTLRPGDGSDLYRPPAAAPQPQAPQPAMQPQQQQAQQSAPSFAPPGTPTSNATDDRSAFRVSQQQQTGVTQASASAINWRAAISDAAKVASLASGDGADLGRAGGERGFTAEAGPLSFETKWYDWGDYAQSMVSKIRVNWYGQMPQLIRTGMKGVATIRFTIQRDGRITNVEIVESSGVPPYDFAARKAIEMSSPLNALPKDFPNDTERVVAMFFYNSEPTSR